MLETASLVAEWDLNSVTRRLSCFKISKGVTFTWLTPIDYYKKIELQVVVTSSQYCAKIDVILTNNFNFKFTSYN